MRNVVIPNLPFLPSPPIPSLSLIGCHERLDVCLVCACVPVCVCVCVCVWHQTTVGCDCVGWAAASLKGGDYLIPRDDAEYIRDPPPTHTHTLEGSVTFFFFTSFFFSFCFHQSVNLSALSPIRLSHFDAPHIMPTLEHTQQGVGWGVRQKWVEECGKCHPSDNDRKKCPCVCALAWCVCVHCKFCRHNKRETECCTENNRNK